MRQIDMEKYSLPKLSYELSDLEPHISKEQLKLHYEKHHQAYINNANALFEKIEKARNEGADMDMKALLKDLSFNVGGHVLHSYFWKNLKPANGDNMPKGRLLDAIVKEFGSFERFKAEFSKTAVSVEGSGWSALNFCKKHDLLLISQIEKHNVNLYPDFKVLLVLDVWEHAYYLDYKNERAKFVDNFWNIVNWDEVERRYEA